MSKHIPEITIKEHLNIPLDQIQVADENVRHTNQNKDLTKLQENINKFGLIQPVVVIKEGSKYKLIVGQRRFLAFQQLKKPRIPALVIGPLGRTLRQIVSFGENMHRKALPYIDTIKLCKTLYDGYKNMSKKKRIDKIANDLGISSTTVSRYLASDLIPEEVKELVNDGIISRDIAYRITSSHYPNEQKIITIIKNITQLTKEEKERAMAYGAKKSDASVDDIIQHALNPPPTVKITIHIDTYLNNRLEKLSDQQDESISQIINIAISEYLSERE